MVLDDLQIGRIMKETKSAIQDFCFALDGMALSMNMLFLTTYFENSGTSVPTFKQVNKRLDAITAGEGKICTNSLYTSAKNYRAELHAFKKLPEVQEESVQKLIDIGIERTNHILEHIEEYQ